MPNARLTQADFYGQPNPDTIQTRTGPTTVASFGQVPLAISGMQLAEIQKQRAETQKAIKDFDINSGIGNAPSPYQRNFKNLAMTDMDTFLRKAIQLHGGNKAEAVKELMDQTSELNAAWRKRSTQWEAIGQQAQFKFKQASDLLDAAKTGKIQVSPDAMKVAQEALNGIGEFGGPKGGDVMELTDTLKRFDQIMSREAYIQDFAIPGIEAHMAEKGITPKTTRNEYGQKITTYGKEKDLSLFREQAAKDMAWRGIGEGSTMEERIKNNKKALDAALPSDQEVQIAITNPHAPSSSSSSADARPKPAISTGMSPASRYDLGNTGSAGQGVPSTMVPTLSFSEKVGDKMVPMAPREFDGPSGQVKIQAPEFKYISGHWRIVGRGTGTTNEARDVVGAAPTRGSISSAKGQSNGSTEYEVTKQREGRMEFLDYEKNIPRVKSYLGEDFDIWNVVREKAQQKGQAWDQAAFDKLPNGTRQKVMDYLFQ